MYIPFPLDDVALNEPVPANLWDPNGVLLLRKGEVIVDEKHRDRLHMHFPMVEEAEYKAWAFRYTTTLDRLVRGNQSLETIAGATRPMGLESAAAHEESVLDVWPDVHAVLATLLYQGAQAHDFLNRVAQIERRVLDATRTRVDDSLLVLVQLLHDRRVSYNATHALLCGLLCRLVGQTLGLSEAERTALLRAALTMNIAMSRLHDALAKQVEPLLATQRQQVQAHPATGVAVLQQLGVRDPMWLRLVRDHHETPDGVGYPARRRIDGDVPTQLLRLADIYVARLGPRAHRSGLSAHRAARDVYLGADGQPNPVGAAFVKTLGAYIPGSHVRLASGELGVVVRRGRRANTPVVFAVVGRQGLPLGEPALRDTAEPAYEVKAGVPADEVKVRLPLAKLLARL